MRRSTLTEMARNPEFISGIYNYCDRWCERCPLTSRCLVYAQEKEDNDPPETRDINNEAFWKKLGAIFQETRELVEEWAREAGVDLSNVDEAEIGLQEKRRERVERNRLAVAGKEYASSVTEWFQEFEQTISASDQELNESDAELSHQLQDAFEVIQWYQYQIAVKTMRALSSRSEEADWAELEGEPLWKDSDGSAKVALIGMDRSISAWRLVQLCLPERQDQVVPLILQLEKLRHFTEKKFPNARDFIRPGFDEVLGDAN